MLVVAQGAPARYCRMSGGCFDMTTCRERFWKRAKAVGSFALTIATSWQALVVVVVAIVGLFKFMGFW
jgi:hypothetical protein